MTETTSATETKAGGKRWETEDIDQPWSIGEAIGVSMRAMVRHAGSLIVPPLLLTLFFQIIGLTPGILTAFLNGLFAQLLHPQSAASSAFGGIAPPPLPVVPLALSSVWAGVAGFFGAAVVLALLVEACLAAIRDVSIPKGRVWRAFRRAPRILLFQLSSLLAITTIPLIVVGITALVEKLTGEPPSWWVFAIALVPELVVAGFFTLVFTFAPFFMIDDDASFVVSMRKSWRATKHYIGNISLFFLALTPISLLMIAPVLGIVAQAFLWLGLAYGYVRATGRNELPWFDPDFASQSIRKFLRVMFVALLLVFGFLVIWVKSLPTLRGSAWSIKDTLIRASAILTGVAVIVVLLGLLLPFVLDRLEGRRFTFFVAARHVRSQKSGFLTVISILSICGVAISSCALSSVVSVMGGFSQDLKRKILGNNAHIVIDSEAGTPWADYETALESIRKTPGVVGATPVVHGEVMASSSSNLAGVMVSGIEPGSINEVVELLHNIEVGKLDYLEHPEKLTHLPPNEVIGIGPGGEQYFKSAELPALNDDLDPAVRAVIRDKADRPSLILGRELAKTLHVYVGDEVTLVSPLGDLGPMGVMPRTKRFRVAAIFYSGMYEYDATYVYTTLGDAQEYFTTGEKIHAIEIKVDDAERAEKLTAPITAALNRPELRVRDWREINKNLFSALKLERFATFIILSIAILVASFCIICTLLLMVTEKGKEIAILKAVGASDRTILGTFMIEGMIIGGIGTIFGVATGLAMCMGLSWFGLRLDPEVYYIDRLPITVNGWDFLTVAVAALSICTLATLYPAWAASRLRPVDGLRYE